MRWFILRLSYVYRTYIVRISYVYRTYIVRIFYVYRTQNSKYIVNTFVLTTSTFKRFIVSLSHAYRTFIVRILYVYRALSQKKFLYQIWLSKTRLMHDFEILPFYSKSNFYWFCFILSICRSRPPLHAYNQRNPFIDSYVKAVIIRQFEIQ